MKSTATKALVALAAAAFSFGVFVPAHAVTPTPNGIHYNLYAYGWDFCNPSLVSPPPTPPASGANVGTSQVVITDPSLYCPDNGSGWGVNGHAWQFSADGGGTAAVFGNSDNFSFGADLTLHLVGIPHGAEAGLNIAPPWATVYAAYLDGRINCRVPDGEIACFGGNLPFYSFTATNGIHFLADDPTHLEIHYVGGSGPNEATPGRVEYVVVQGGITYTSPWLNCSPPPYNPSDPPAWHDYGIGTPSFAGGFMQPQVDVGNLSAQAVGTWNNVSFSSDMVVPTRNASWGSIKSLYR